MQHMSASGGGNHLRIYPEENFNTNNAILSYYHGELQQTMIQITQKNFKV